MKINLIDSNEINHGELEVVVMRVKATPKTTKNNVVALCDELCWGWNPDWAARFLAGEPLDRTVFMRYKNDWAARMRRKFHVSVKRVDHTPEYCAEVFTWIFLEEQV